MMIERFIKWLVNPIARKWHAIIIGVITVLFVSQLPKLQFNFELEQLFPSKHEDLAYFNAHIEEYGYDNDFLSILILSEQDKFQPAYLQVIRAVSDSLSGLPEIITVWNPLKLKRLVSTSQGAIPFDLFEDSGRFEADKKFSTNDPFLGQFFRYDGFLPISAQHQHITDQQQAAALQKKIESILKQHSLDYHILGKIAAQEEFNSYIKSDFGIFIGASIVICLIILWALFRSITSTLFPLAICLITLIWVFGLMALIGIPISIMTSLIPPLMLFVASSDGVHYLSALKSAKNREAAIQKVLKPTLLTSITTGIGFLSLLWIPVIPISELGFLCGMGTFIAFIVTYLLVPFISEATIRKSNWRPQFFQSIWKARKPIYGVFLVIFTFCLFGSFQLESDAYLLKDLPVTSTTRQSFDFGDKKLGGSKPWEIAVFLKDSSGSVWSPDVMKEVDEICQYLKSEFSLSELRSPSEILKYANFVQFGNLSIPDKMNRSFTLARQILRRQGFRLVSNEKNSLRITGLIPEIGSKATVAKNEELLSYLQSNVDTKLLGFRLTGTNYLIDKSNELLAAYMLQSILMAIGLVAVFMAIYFKSIKLALVSLVPNLLPLLMVGNIIYLADIPIQFSTSIIFALTFGIVVDDTIHFLTTYKRTSGSVDERIQATMNSAGIGIFNTSLILIAGFAIMMASSFGATFYLGLFLSSSLFFALITDMILLPILIKSLKL